MDISLTWSKELREATASDPLTLEEEYEMQQSWRIDTDKLTFIACLPPVKQNGGIIVGGNEDASDRMIGDVNLFLSIDEDSEQMTNGSTDGRPQSQLIGELELMVARKDLHSQGFGREMILAMLQYVMLFSDAICNEFTSGMSGIRGSSNVSLEILSVKIAATNDRSIRLFESLGFSKSSPKPNYFGEWELRRPANRQSLQDLLMQQGKKASDEWLNPLGFVESMVEKAI